jgi:hypothetical protein
MVRPRVVTGELRREAAWGMARGRQKLALGLLVCLPVPLLAMSGLAVPLPSAVYRAAVAIVQSTEGLARTLTATGQETRILSARRTTGTAPIATTRSRSSGRVVERVASRRSSVRVQSTAENRSRGLDGAPRNRSRASRRSVSPAVRTPSAPSSGQRSETAPAAAQAAAAPAPAQAPAQAVTKESPPVEPTPRPVAVAPIEPVSSKPPANSSPPAPPPPPVSEPTLVDPVTKPLEPVTKSLEPATEPLAPVTDTLQPVTKPLEPVTGGLGILNP